MKCNDCKKDFRVNSRGSKRVPIPLCQGCVLKRIIHECESCHSKGSTKKGFYKTECWECRKEGCTKCIPYETKIMGVDFSFCEQHKDYDKDKLKFDTEELLEEERRLAGESRT